MHTPNHDIDVRVAWIPVITLLYACYSFFVRWGKTHPNDRSQQKVIRSLPPDAFTH